MQFILYRLRVIDAKTFEQTKPVVTENQEVEYRLESMSLTFFETVLTPMEKNIAFSVQFSITFVELCLETMIKVAFGPRTFWV